MTVVLRSLAAVVLLLAGLVPAAAQEGGPPLIDITRGRVDPLPIAIPDFYGNDGEARQLGKDIAGVVSADLESSGLFRPLDKAAFLQSGEALLEQPRFEDWRAINAQILVTGQVTASGNDLSVEFRLWDVAPGLQLSGMRYNATADNWRRIAHIIADAIYERITGEQGYFDTRIVFVAESGGEQNRTKRLAIMDQDGANLRYLTDGDNLVLTPRFSPTAQEITYMMYQGDDARVYLRNLDSGRQELVGDFDGMTFAPRFAPSGRSVLLSLARDGNSEIYAMDLATRNIRRLTHAPGIDTSPSAAPDGTRIAFNSDRGGSPQIYVMGSGGGNPQRISFGDGSYYTPVWSPRGDYIAFTKIKGGRFYIGVMAPDGSGERLLSEGFLVEGPTWAPNGRVLMYTRNDGSGPRLYSIDVSGYNERRIPTPTDASDPAWSPLLH